MADRRRTPLLVGLPGAGKTTVGQALARLLATRFIDVDRVIEDRETLSINEIFASRGEHYFRNLESRLVKELVQGPPLVIAPGGGWACQPGNLESVRSRAFTVYLSVPVEEAAARLDAVEDRPLLAGRDPRTALAALWRVRSPWYERCEVTVPAADRPPEDLARELELLAHQKAGW